MRTSLPSNRISARKAGDEFEAVAVREVLAWQIEQAMKEKNISRNNLAQAMKTSRSQIWRLLDAKN
ncbi:hypothetical protein ACTGJ9_037100 [Bradyrhizobium sp. RDM12]